MAFQQFVGAALMPRLALLANHVLSREPAAVERLRPHAGKFIRLHVRDAPAALAWLPSVLTVVVTPAGLLDWDDGAERVADLEVHVDASNPARTVADAVSGRRPQVDVAGDAALAADVSWLADHLRWDVQDDLARVVGDGPALALTRFGAAVASGLRQVAHTLASAASDWRHRSANAQAEPPPR